MIMETGIDGNCPTWKGASQVYSKAYKYMDEHGPDYDLIAALNEGDEEWIKGILLDHNTRSVFGIIR